MNSSIDSAELSFVFLSSTCLTLWTKQPFVAPALLSLVQHVLFYPMITQSVSDSTILRFNIIHGVSGWAGSISGMCLAAALDSPILLFKHHSRICPSITNAAILMLLGSTPLMRIALRAWLSTRYAWMPPIGMSIGILAVATFIWSRPYMAALFARPRDIHVFALGCGFMHVGVLMCFGALDIVLEGAPHDDSTTGLVARVSIIVVATMFTVIARYTLSHSRVRYGGIEFEPPPELSWSTSEIESEDDVSSTLGSGEEGYVSSYTLESDDD